MKVIFPNAVQHKRLSELSHDDWLQARQEGIGGSDAAAILGMNKYKSAFNVFLDKKGLSAPTEDNLNMLIGRELEDTVARLFEKETGKKVKRSGFMYRNNQRAWQLADVDRMVVGENAGLECKTTSSTLNIKKLKGGDFPDEYYAQCVHYMSVTGADRWYLAILVLGFAKEFHIFVLDRDETEIEALNETEQSFWSGNVLEGIEPSPDGSTRTSEYISDTFPDSTHDKSIDLRGHEDKLSEYLRLKDELDSLDKSVKASAQSLQLIMKDAEIAIADGYKVLWKSCSRSGGIDSKKLKTEYPEAYTACVKPDTKYRRFTIEEV